MIEKSCFFTGHRHIPDNMYKSLNQKLEIEIAWMINHGVTNFYTGGALGFDTMAALSVLNQKQLNKNVILNLIIPYPEQSEAWDYSDKDTYYKIYELADSCSISSDHYYKGVMQRRNRQLVESAKYCICYFDPKMQKDENKISGGTRFTVNYAKKLGRNIINLADSFLDNISDEVSQLSFI